MKALVLGCGGVKGAAQIGVLRQLYDTEKVDYDIFAGVSVGAINASKLASGPLSETLPELEDIWLNQITGNSCVWNHRLLKQLLISICVILFFTICGFILFIISVSKIIPIIFAILTLCSFYLPYNVLHKNYSVYTTEPLRKLIEKNINSEKIKSSAKKLRIGAVSFNTGEFRVVDEYEEHLVDWIMASSAFPVFFPRVFINGQYWTDGGLVDIAPLSAAIDAGATEVDIILTNPTVSGYYSGLPGILKQLIRDVDITISEALRSDLEARCKYHGKNVKIRIFKPEYLLTSNPLEFNPGRIRRMYEEGKHIVSKFA